MTAGPFSSSTFSFSMLMASFAAVAALGALWWIRDTADTTSAYIGFTASLVIWGWNEMAFLMGYLSGPRRTPCPPDAVGFRRFRFASETLIDHELGILASGVLIAAVTWGGANQFGLWTFIILWLMRLSTKLNIFLGAPNIPDEFLPEHLRYLASYFRRLPMNGFFPFAVTAATLLTAYLLHAAFAGEVTAFQRHGYLLLGTLMALAVLEHWLLYVPLSATKLWGWGLKSHQRTQESRLREVSTASSALVSWSADLALTCNPKDIGAVLDAVVTGSFGHVERLDGTARTDNGWLRFAVADGHASLDRVANMDTRQARVTAVGRAFDKERLGAAFAACAA